MQYLKREEVLHLSEKNINYGDLSTQAMLSEKTINYGDLSIQAVLSEMTVKLGIQSYNWSQ